MIKGLLPWLLSGVLVGPIPYCPTEEGSMGSIPPQKNEMDEWVLGRAPRFGTLFRSLSELVAKPKRKEKIVRKAV